MTQDEINAGLFDEVKRLQKELIHAKANNDNLTERNRILRCRPDLPVDTSAWTLLTPQEVWGVNAVEL